MKAEEFNVSGVNLLAQGIGETENCYPRSILFQSCCPFGLSPTLITSVNLNHHSKFLPPNAIIRLSLFTCLIPYSGD